MFLGYFRSYFPTVYFPTFCYSMLGRHKVYRKKREMTPLIERIAAIRTLPRRGKRVLNGLLERSGLRLAAMWLGYALLGFLLAGGSVAGQAMPFAVSLIAAVGPPLHALAVLVGGAAGYLSFFGLNGGLEQLAAGSLVFSAVCITSRAELRASRWLMPLLTAALSFLVGALFLVQARFAPGAVVRFAVRLAAAGVSVRIFSRARQSRSSLLYLLFCALNGCAAIPLAARVNLGQVMAVAVAASAVGTPSCALLGAVAGLAVDLASMPEISLTALLCFAGLTASALPIPLKPARSLAFLAAAVAGVLFTGGQVPELVPAAALGCCLSLPIPRFPVEDEGREVRRRLEQAALVLADAGTLLAMPEPLDETGAAGVFDRASDRVCGSCVLWSQCWQRKSQETYLALCAAAGPLLERGTASREDFPASFAESCCHLDELTAAIDRELDRQAIRRQYQSRLRECREALVEQYGCLSNFFRRTAARLTRLDTPELRYTPELGVGAVGKGGGGVSGDRGACFQNGEGMYFVLLCDGMGTGPEAAAESRRAIRLLAGMLQAGLDPSGALDTLNGVYVLRGDGVFSTVDLLAVSLATGEAALYKWGASPSYLKTSSGTIRIGTASPPPGFGVGEAHKAEAHRLSLGEGEMLVLLSDGAGGEEAGRRIAEWDNGSPKQLAAALIDQRKGDGEDDRTAVALRLHRRPAWTG